MVPQLTTLSNGRSARNGSLMGTSLIDGPFSIAIFDYRKVNTHLIPSSEIYYCNTPVELVASYWIHELKSLIGDSLGYVSMYLSIDLSIYLSIYLPIYQSIHLSMYI